MISLRVSPSWPCWLCHGRGTHGDLFRRQAFGLCPACHGGKRRTRLGVKVLMPGLARDIKAGKHGRFY